LADHKRVRDIHIILQIVCRAREEGLETGNADFRCQHCNKGFLLLTANDNTAQNEDSDGEVASIVPFPVVRLGFTEVQQLTDDQIVKCPQCGKDSYPFATIPLDFD
jgi:Zn finger protein HypA/HybF involved in hydrogenase expression